MPWSRSGLDAPAAKGNCKATPLWLRFPGAGISPAAHLLKRGVNPNFCPFAAVWNKTTKRSAAALDHGAISRTARRAGETLLMGAVAWLPLWVCRFIAKSRRDPTLQMPRPKRAHMMLGKGSAPSIGCSPPGARATSGRWGRTS